MNAESVVWIQPAPLGKYTDVAQDRWSGTSGTTHGRASKKRYIFVLFFTVNRRQFHGSPNQSVPPSAKMTCECVPISLSQASDVTR